MPEKCKWIQPKLIVLGRGTPEESVLVGCKSQNTPIGQGSTNSECASTKQQVCQNCQGQNIKS